MKNKRNMHWVEGRCKLHHVTRIHTFYRPFSHPPMVQVGDPQVGGRLGCRCWQHIMKPSACWWTSWCPRRGVEMAGVLRYYRTDGQWLLTHDGLSPSRIYTSTYIYNYIVYVTILLKMMSFAESVGFVNHQQPWQEAIKHGPTGMGCIQEIDHSFLGF